MDALAFLDQPPPDPPRPIYALVGDEDFLKRRARDALVAAAVGDADPAFAVTSYAGDKLDFSTVRNDLDTLSFLSPRRVVVVEPADGFVTAHRPALEKYAAAPSKSGILILDVKTFPETTKLAKALPDAAKLNCKAPPPFKLAGWCVGWAKTAHRKRLAPDAAELLVDRVGAALGTLAQELDKLAVAVGAKPGISAADVDRLVARSKSADVFRILDAVGDGQPGEALGILEELFAEGEDPLAVMGPLTAQLRKLAAVGRFLADGQPLGPAMDAAGVPKWEKARQSTERQLRHLGRRRLDALTTWLVELNLGLKGGSPLPNRVQVEMLVVKLARPRA